LRHVVFQVEKERYALPLSAVREVVLPPAVFSRVPKAPGPIRGVMNLRGRVVMVVEARRLLKISEGGGNLNKVLLLDRDRRDLGLFVTEVEGIEVIEKVMNVPGQGSPGVRGVARLRGAAVTVLDPEGLDGEVTALFQSK
jgi:purine-binding chemotaxis protein CheW